MPRRARRLSAFSLLLLASIAHADVLRVPQDHASIQSAVDSASDGDVIRIRKGTYAEQVVVAGRSGLTLQAQGKVTIDAGSGGPALRIVDSERVTVSRLVFTGGSVQTLHLLRSTECVVTRCRIESGGPRALLVAAGGGHLITKNRLSGNPGDCIDLDSDNNVNAFDCTIAKNRVTGGSVGIEIQGTGHVVQKNRVRGTTDVGIQSFQGDDLLIEKNQLSRLEGEGIRVRTANSRVLRNKIAGTMGDGIYIQASATDALIERNVIKNVAGESSDGIDTDESVDRVTIRRNKIVRTSDDGCDLAITNSLVERNTILRSGDDGIRVGPETTGTEFRANRTKRSGGDGLIDLTDEQAGNTFTGNKFDSIAAD